MKVEIKEGEKKTSEYPCIKVSNENRYVLFIRRCTGVLIKDESDKYDIGHYSNTWNEWSFIPFNGVIKLSNK